MKKLFAITGVIFLCSAFVFVVVCAGADMNANSDSSALVARPSKGTWSGNSYIFAGACPDGSNLVIDSAKGFATFLGASDLFAAYCLNMSTLHGEGNAVITAANGDAIFFAIDIQLTFTSEEGGTWAESETVLGGTGRFADATGASTATGAWAFTSPTTLTWVGTHEGEITY